MIIRSLFQCSSSKRSTVPIASAIVEQFPEFFREQIFRGMQLLHRLHQKVGDILFEWYCLLIKLYQQKGPQLSKIELIPLS